MIYYLLNILVTTILKFLTIVKKIITLVNCPPFHCQALIDYLLSSCSLVQGTLFFSAISNAIAVIKHIICSLV